MPSQNKAKGDLNFSLNQNIIFLDAEWKDSNFFY